jgi:hypothetical protein
MARPSEYKVDGELVSKHYAEQKRALNAAVVGWLKGATTLPDPAEDAEAIVQRLASHAFPVEEFVVDDSADSLIHEGGSPTTRFSAPIKGDLKLLALVNDGGVPFELHSDQGRVSFAVHAHKDPTSLKNAIDTAIGHVRDHLAAVNKAVKHYRDVSMGFAKLDVQRRLDTLAETPGIDAAVAALGIKKRGN